MACTFRAIGTTASGRDKLRVPLVERCVFQDQQDIAVDPELQVAYRQQNTPRFRCAVVYLFEARRECLLLLVCGQLRQQQCMAHANLIGIESIDRCGYKVGQLQPRSNEDRCLYGALSILRYRPGCPPPALLRMSRMVCITPPSPLLHQASSLRLWTIPVRQE